jgi:MGT family glycosyltransferase
MSKTVAIFTEPAAIGPLMNCIGIAQGLLALGHTPVFLIDPSIAGNAAKYGFREVLVPSMEPMPPEKAAKYWEDFIRDSIPTFKTTPYDQISTYVKDCWEAIFETVYWAQKNLPEAIASVRPDVILSDNVALYPAIEMAGCPWVRMISCSENEIPDDNIPPHLSGCHMGDQAGFDRFREKYTEVIGPLHNKFNDYVESCGHKRLPSNEFVEPSPHLNLLLYPQPLQYERSKPLDPTKYQYLDGCVRTESEPYEVPIFAVNNDAPLIYLTFGSLGVADTELLHRLITTLAQTQYRVLINVGDYIDEYKDLPDNVQISSWFPQSALIPKCDLVIQHGGNNTLNESLFNAKPVLVMPFAWDGHDNAARVSDTGHGLSLPRYDWTDEELLDSIETLLSDQDIKERLRATSSHMQANDGRTKAAKLISQLIENN